MQYEISGSVLAGQITTTTWAGAPSRTWAWSRAIGGAGQFASWTRAAQLRTSDLGGGSGGPGHGTPQAFNSAVDLPRARLGRRQRSIGSGRAVDQGGSVRDVGLGGGSVEDLGLAQGDRWGWPRHRRSWPARGVRLGGGSGGPGHGTPPGVQLCGGPAQGAPWAKAAARSGLGAPWTRAAQLATSAWAVAPSRTWA